MKERKLHNPCNCFNFSLFAIWWEKKKRKICSSKKQISMKNKNPESEIYLLCNIAIQALLPRHFLGLSVNKQTNKPRHFLAFLLIIQCSKQKQPFSVTYMN